MLDQLKEKEGVSIVLLGEFNPIIIQPFWLSFKGLIREEEAENANVELIHPEVVKFSLDWFSIEVSKQRCEIKTTSGPYIEPTKDLTIEIFKILKETPLKSFGFNHVYNIKMRTKEDYVDFGDKLVPKKYWEGLINNSGVIVLEVIEQGVEDPLLGRKKVRITPYVGKDSQNEIVITVNDHYQQKNGEYNLQGNNLLRILEENWKKSKSDSLDIVEKLINRVRENGK